MRRLLTSLGALGLLSVSLTGCHHSAGICDCQAPYGHGGHAYVTPGGVLLASGKEASKNPAVLARGGAPNNGPVPGNVVSRTNAPAPNNNKVVTQQLTQPGSPYHAVGTGAPARQEPVFKPNAVFQPTQSSVTQPAPAVLTPMPQATPQVSAPLSPMPPMVPQVAPRVSEPARPVSEPPPVQAPSFGEPKSAEPISVPAKKVESKGSEFQVPSTSEISMPPLVPPMPPVAAPSRQTDSVPEAPIAPAPPLVPASASVPVIPDLPQPPTPLMPPAPSLSTEGLQFN